ncbi:MAG: pitrilysin family protein [Bacteroidia bacterium]
MKKIFSFLVMIISVIISPAQTLDRSVRPVAGPAPKIQLGNIESFVLPNGLKVFVVENHKLPRVAFSLVLDVNPVLEGDSKGYVDAAGELLSTGTQKRSKDELNNEVDFIGATFSTSAEGMYGECLVQHQDKLLDIMSDELMNAQFTQTELDKIKKKMTSQIVNREDDPDAIASSIRDVVDFGKQHPYGEIESKESVKNITLDKCENYYKTYFHPNVAYLAIVGDINFKKAKKLTEKYFRQWQKADVPSVKYDVPKAPDADQVIVVNKPGAVQSVVNVTYPINLLPSDPDALKAKVMNTILGGGASCRLFLDLREKHGYTYGAYSSLSNDELVGSFTAFAKVRNAVTDSSVTQILYEMKKLRDEKVGNDELQGIKNYMTGIFAIGLESPQTVANYAINIEKYKLPADYYTNYLKNLNAITPDDIYEVAQKYMTPQNATILVVGNKEEIASKLAKFSASGKIIFLNTDGEEEKTMRSVPPGITAETVIDNYVKAIGGKENLDKIKDVTTKMTASIQGMDLEIVNYQKAPDKFFMSMGKGKMIYQKQIFDGTKGITSGMGDSKEMKGKELEELKNQSTLNLEMNYEKLGFKLTLKGIDVVNGNDAYVLDVESPTGKKQTEYYDVNSGFKVRVSQIEGDKIQITDMSDYKAVNDVKYPYLISQTIGSQTFLMKVSSIEINTGIKDDVFSTVKNK